MEIPRFAGTRVTQRRRVHFAKRQTLRRQRYEQVGGGRAAGVTPASLTNSFFEDYVGIDVRGTDFAFLSDPSGWYNSPNAAKNYFTILVARQDEFMQLAINAIKAEMDISAGTDDFAILEKIRAEDEDILATHVLKLITSADLIALNDNKALQEEVRGENFCDARISRSKFYYNFLRAERAGAASSLKSLRNKIPTVSYQIASVLLYPALVQNVAVYGIANIMKGLHDDADLVRKLRDRSVDTTLPVQILKDKYVSHLFTLAREMTADKLRDSAAIWSCAATGEDSWYIFFTEFLDTLKTNEQRYPAHKRMTLKRPDPFKQLGLIAGILFNKTERIAAGNFREVYEIFSKPRLASSGPTTRSATAAMSVSDAADALRVARQALENVAADATAEEIQRLSEAVDRAATDLETAISEAAERAPLDVNTVNTNTTGLLPISTWSQTIEGGVTTQRLLNAMTPEEIHFMFHLVHVYHTLLTAPAGT